MIRYGLFRFGPLRYAIPLLSMRKIVHQSSGYRLPQLPRLVAETLVDDGQLIPLIKLSGLVANDEISVRSVDYKVLAESEAGTVAFPAEETCGIVAEQKGDLLEADDEQGLGVVGLFKYQETQYKILDIDTLAIAVTSSVQQE